MTRPLMVCIQRTCSGCGVRNRVMTPEIRPSWTINCSGCGTLLLEHRRSRPRLVRPVLREGAEAQPAG